MDDRTKIVTYSSDHPIRSKREDRFNRARFATHVADTIATRLDPSSIVIGLYGPWGDGKSSTLNLMEEALAAHSEIVVVRFNPWLFDSEDRLLRGFFDTLATALGSSLPAKAERIGALLRNYRSMLLMASFHVAGGLETKSGGKEKTTDDSLAITRLDEVSDAFREAMERAGKRVVVLIDDVDRLNRGALHAIFKLVKLSASFPYTSYVLSFDDEMVASSISEQYAHGGYEAGRNYLAKIIQVPLHLPPPDAIQLRQMVFDGIADALAQSGVEFEREQADAFAHQFAAGLEPRLATPRNAKLYVNAVTFALPLLKGEAHLVDLLLMEGIRVFYPKLYLAIRENAELFLGGGRDPDQNAESAQRQRLADVITKSAGEMTPERNAGLRRDLLEALFPRLSTAMHGDEWESKWAREQRVCSGQYFWRYFTYSVPPRDVGDHEVKAFLDGIAFLDRRGQDAALEAFARRGAFPRFVHKLHQYAPNVKGETARALASAIARNGTLAAQERGQPSAPDSTFGDAADLITDFVKRTESGQARDQVACSIVEIAEPLTFALECFRRMSRNADRAEEDQLLSIDGESAARSTLIDRIRSQAAAAPLYRAFSRGARGLYRLWAQQSALEVAADLGQKLEADPAEVDVFLASCSSEILGAATSDVSQVADFGREAYEAIAELIDPDSVAAALVRCHGPGLGSGDFYQLDAASVAARIAHQFLWMHRHIQDERAEQAAAAADSELAPVPSEHSASGAVELIGLSTKV